MPIPPMIYVANTDRMCFWVYADKLEPSCVSCYDPYVFTNYMPYITTAEWSRRRGDAEDVGAHYGR